MKKGQFKLQKVGDVGTSNPIFSRLMGLHDIIQLASISEEQKEVIKLVNYKVMCHLIKAEKIGNKIRGQIENKIEQIKKDGVKTQSFERCVDLPCTENLEDMTDFLKSSKKALQEMMKIFNLFIETGYTNPRYDKVISELKNKYGENDDLVRITQEDYDLWIKKLLDLRDEEEHPKAEQFLHDFDINYDEKQQKWIVSEPKFYEGTPVYSFIETTIHNLFTFCEETSIYFLGKHLPKMVGIYEIPKEERNSDNEIRFRAGLKHKLPK